MPKVTKKELAKRLEKAEAQIEQLCKEVARLKLRPMPDRKPAPYDPWRREPWVRWQHEGEPLVCRGEGQLS